MDGPKSEINEVILTAKSSQMSTGKTGIERSKNRFGLKAWCTLTTNYALRPLVLLLIS